MAIATTTANNLTLADIVRYAKDPTARAMIEIMNLTNEIISDAPAMVCNNKLTHITTLRDDIPFPVFRMFNQGSPIVKSALRQTTEHTAMLSNWLQADKSLLNISTDKAGIILSESQAVLEGLAQGGTTALFYGDHSMDPAAFTGFTPRYNSLDPVIPQSRNVIDAGGTGAALTSIWLIQWDSSGCHLLYPEGTTAGVKKETYENEILYDNNGDPYTGVMINFHWHLGLAVRDWRRVVRIANVDVNSLQTLITGGVNLQNTADFRLLRHLVEAIDLLPNKAAGRTMFYTGRQVHTYLNILAAERHNVGLTYTTPMGTPPITSFQGIPIRRVDSLVVGEDQVTA